MSPFLKRKNPKNQKKKTHQKTTTPFYRPDGPTHDLTKGIMLEMSNLGISTVTLITSCVSAQLHLYADLHSWSVLRRPPCSMSHSAHCFWLMVWLKITPRSPKCFVCLFDGPAYRKQEHVWRGPVDLSDTRAALCVYSFKRRHFLNLFLFSVHWMKENNLACI